ncbi:hypothetical protein CONLIGDRAFT_587369 [Coniochaeta ligniaria NRRL 30616]|uniref:tRNA-intron lyase n=1 Tax=Coniochaeta ligniaria NRRL 30616 TaxID=1408157 RepID=A0A1J7J007_9PEZI|nr:hypothetical protein CONLIGDRAFT_587369 [Coniochaeta ligniaria NRRL 30616]
MADSITIPPSIPPAMEVAPPAAELTADSQSRPRNRGPPLNQIYALPAPIRTFPLPSFYPSNPISLFHLVYTWMKQVLSPPPAEPSIIHTGIWDPDSRSVHITDPTAVRAFWEQGFYGKGNLSRSEPNWLKREQIRRGAVEGDVSEQRTALRREERRQVKWERARTEQEALERTRREEAELAVTVAPVLSKAPLLSKAPVGPLEQLALPNCAAQSTAPSPRENIVARETSVIFKAPVGPLELLALPNSAGEIQPPLTATVLPESLAPELITAVADVVEASLDIAPVATTLIPGSKHALEMPDAAEAQPPKRRKSVRFSATVESTTFLHHDPPSPDRSVVVARCKGAAVKQDDKASAPPVSSRINSPPKVTAVIENKEHLQLSAEEAFFLAYGIGALSILDPDTKMPIPREKLLGLFRSHSYFPPRQELQPSDPFLVHYAVYHHFRSLGWVPRHGIKFGVDWMLYTRGPVFDHAEFGLIVMPSYSHSWWKENGIEAPRKSWHWLHGVNRVLSHVLKSLVLVYVDVPPPHIFDAAMAAGGVSAALKEYKVREFMVRRWSSNRNR